MPRVIGNRIDAAGLAKIAAGKVRDEMKLAMITTMCSIIQSVSSGPDSYEIIEYVRQIILVYVIASS